MLFLITALDSAGSKIKKEIEAQSEDEARSNAESIGLFVMNIKSKNDNSEGFLAKILHREPKIDTNTLCQFFSNVSEMSASGVGMLQILGVLSSDDSDKEGSAFIAKIAKAMSGGVGFADAVRKAAPSLDPLYANLIGIAEEVGDYQRVLTQLVDYIKWSGSIRKKVKGALIKGVISIIFVLSTVIGAATVVVPKMVPFLTDMGIKMPPQTLALIAFSDFINNDAGLLFGIIVALIVGFKVAKKSIKQMETWGEKIKNKMPIVGKLSSQIDCLRFLSFFSLMYSCNLPLEVILDKVQTAVRGKTLRKELAIMKRQISDGVLFQDAILQSKCLPKKTSKTISMAFVTQNVLPTLKNTQFFLNQDVDNKMDAAIGSIKPIIMGVTTSLLMWIISAIMLPIYANMGNMLGGGKEQGSAQKD